MRFVCLIVAAFCWVSTAWSAPPPAHLPRYDLHVRIDTEKRNAEILQRVTWTNRSKNPTKELVFNFYPLYQIPHGDFLLLSKTLELLRLDPQNGIDRIGGHGQIDDIRVYDRPGDATGVRVKYWYQDDNPCALVAELPRAIGPGESVTMDILCQIRLPMKQGRWGQWDGITYLTHALPTVSFHDDSGWHSMPFVPWHQPFWNEAAVYRATIELPPDETLACSAAVQSTSLKDGRKVVVCEPFVGRDFAILCSKKYKEFNRTARLHTGKEVSLRCFAFEHHAHYAKEMLVIAEEAILTYSRWFTPYPYDQFTIAESYFGWNGNECSGLVMIDERVFDMPKSGHGYVEYLVSHETCHQWWYNLIGTNGYSETFMDEGPATYFTHRMLDKRHGRNNDIVQWPEHMKYAPRIRRDTYRYASMIGAIRKNEMPAAAGQLPEFGNLFNLFTGAYDRGSKIYAMIEDRMGEAAFFDFIQEFMVKHAFDVVSASMLKADLEKYTGKNWDDLFERWVYGSGLTDWSLESVDINRERPVGPRVEGTQRRYRATVRVRQNGEYTEPTTIGFRFADQKGFPIRVPIGPVNDRMNLPDHEGQVIRVSRDEYQVEVVLPERPTNVVVDPDRVLLDANPGNNSWDRTPRVNVTPLYSLMSDTDLTNDYDRWNFNIGPWVWGASNQDPWYTRSTMYGIRAGAYRTQQFQGGIYSAIRSDYRDIVVGADALFDHVPLPQTQIGFNYERRVAGPFFGNEGQGGLNRASLFGRYVLRSGTSLYLAPVSYADIFTAYTDNFLPFAQVRDPGGERPQWTWLSGLHYRLNLFTPYWNAERGIWVDVTYGAGPGRLAERTTVHQFKGEFAAAQKLKDGNEFWSDIRLAGRLALGAAWPNRGEFFALGGGTLFRGFDLAERQGSLYWVVNAEARIPLLRDLKWNLFDNVAGVRKIYGAAFYDVGGIYANSNLIGNVAHAIGGGLRVDTAIFSFIERATFRVDVAKTLNAASPVQIWIGLQHPF